MAQRVKCLPVMRETWVRSLGRDNPLEKEMATHSSILAWRIPWTDESGRLQCPGSQRVRHDWVTSLSLNQMSTACLLCSRHSINRPNRGGRRMREKGRSRAASFPSVRDSWPFSRGWEKFWLCRCGQIVSFILQSHLYHFLALTD